MYARLLRACGFGDVAKVRTYLAKGADVNLIDGYMGGTPLMVAMYHNQLEVVTALLSFQNLDMAAVDGNTGLHFMDPIPSRSNITFNSSDCIKVLGGDSRMTEQLVNMKNRFGETALMMALKGGFVYNVIEICKLEGVDWKTKNDRG